MRISKGPGKESIFALENDIGFIQNAINIGIAGVR